MASITRAAGGRVVFLSEMDGVDRSNDGVLILAATNAPWHLDSAFRRPGRFDRILFVPPPDAPARATILRLLLRGKPCQDVDFDHLARNEHKVVYADSGCRSKARVAALVGPVGSVTPAAAVEPVEPVEPVEARPAAVSVALAQVAHRAATTSA